MREEGRRLHMQMLQQTVGVAIVVSADPDTVSAGGVAWFWCAASILLHSY